MADPKYIYKMFCKKCQAEIRLELDQGMIQHTTVVCAHCESPFVVVEIISNLQKNRELTK